MDRLPLKWERENETDVFFFIAINPLRKVSVLAEPTQFNKYKHTFYSPVGVTFHLNKHLFLELNGFFNTRSWVLQG